MITLEDHYQSLYDYFKSGSGELDSPPKQAVIYNDLLWENLRKDQTHKIKRSNKEMYELCADLNEQARKKSIAPDDQDRNDPSIIREALQNSEFVDSTIKIIDGKKHNTYAYAVNALINAGYLSEKERDLVKLKLGATLDSDGETLVACVLTIKDFDRRIIDYDTNSFIQKTCINFMILKVLAALGYKRRRDYYFAKLLSEYHTRLIFHRL